MYIIHVVLDLTLDLSHRKDRMCQKDPTNASSIQAHDRNSKGSNKFERLGGFKKIQQWIFVISFQKINGKIHQRSHDSI